MLSRRPLCLSVGCHIYGGTAFRLDPDHTPTIALGAAKRFACQPPIPEAKHIEGLGAFVRDFLQTNLTPLAADTDVTLESWLNNSNYSATRKRQVKQALEAWVDDNTTHQNNLLCSVKSFVKREPYMVIKHARCINARNDTFKALVGPIFSAIEKQLFKNPYFIKYVPVADRPRVIMEELYRYNGLYMATDFAHFESHFEKLIFETIEFQLYDHMTQFLPSHKDFMALLRRVLCGVNVCKFRRLLVFIIAGRLSGEMNTSLGNGFTNLMLILYACKCSGIVKPPGKIEGDDSLFVIPHKIDSTIFEKCGFTIVINYFEKLEHASFCGMIFDRNALQNVTDPYKYLLNFGWLKENYVMSSRKTQMKLLLSRSISLLVTYPACPILTSLAKYGLRCSRRYKYPKNDGDTRYEKARLRDDYERFYTNKFSRDPIHLDTRFLVNDVFKIDIDTQLQIEKYLDSLDDVQPLEHPRDRKSVV